MTYLHGRSDEDYFRAMRKDAEAFELPSGSEWFNLSHHHVDWESRGDYSPEKRRACIEAILLVFEAAVSQSKSLSLPCQVWALLDPADSGQDAVYFHTPNPHTAYPYEFEGVIWNGQRPALLEGVSLPAEVDVGVSRTSEAGGIWLRRRAV